SRLLRRSFRLWPPVWRECRKHQDRADRRFTRWYPFDRAAMVGWEALPMVKLIRALSRGLEVMRRLEMEGPATPQALALRTGLPKPTLMRVLLTLEKEGYVRRGIGDRL